MIQPESLIEVESEIKRIIVFGGRVNRLKFLLDIHKIYVLQSQVHLTRPLVAMNREIRPIMPTMTMMKDAQIFLRNSKFSNKFKTPNAINEKNIPMTP